MRNLSTRLREERELKGLTQKELGDLIGVGGPSICQWETGHVTNITSTNLIKLSAVLCVNPVWLETGTGSRYNNHEALYEGSKERRARSSVPVLTLKNVSDLNGMTDIEIKQWLNCPITHGSNAFTVKVETDSMCAPGAVKNYPESSYIFVDSDAPLSNGAKVLAKLKTGDVVFREYREDGDKFLRPLNPVYSIIRMDESVQIVGVVIGSFIPE